MKRLSVNETAALAVTLSSAEAESAAVVTTSGAKAWLLLLKAANGSAFFAWDPAEGVKRGVVGEAFADWGNVDALVVGDHTYPPRAKIAVIVTSEDGQTVNGYIVGETKAEIPVYALLIVGDAKGKTLKSATVIERSDGRAIHSLCAAHTLEKDVSLLNLLESVCFLTNMAAVDVGAFLKGGVHNVQK